MKLRDKLGKYTAGILAACALVAFSGCGNGTQPGVTEERLVPSSKSARENTEAISRELISHGKAGAGVTVTYKLPAQVNPGESIDLDLAFSAPAGVDTLAVEVRPDGLEILTPQAQQTFDLASSGEHVMPLSVYCPEAGRFYLNLFITRDMGQGRLSHQVQSVPVQVGSVVESKLLRDDVEMDKEGNPVRSLPAKETISEKEE